MHDSISSYATKKVYAVLIILWLGLSAASATAQARYLMYVGTYTDKVSKGIYAFSYDTASGQFAPLGLAGESTNPSFLVVKPDGNFLYAVNEVGDYQGKSSRGVSAFQLDPANGKLKLLNEVPSLGADPCYLAFDQSGRYLLVANYTGGSVAVFPVQSDGRVGQASAFVQHSGSSANTERQEGPHAHWIQTSTDNRHALAADLGSDELLVYGFDPKDGTLAAVTPPFTKVAAGSGPRHAAFSPDGKFVYLLSEMKSTVTVFRYDGKQGALSEIQTITALPAGFSGSNDAAELVMHPSGKFLYASNRGEDGIAVFRVDRATGMLEPVEHVSTEGKTPRSFAIDPTGTLLLAGNQESGTIAVFRIDAHTGRVRATGQKLEAPSPVSIVFVRVKP